MDAPLAPRSLPLAPSSRSAPAAALSAAAAAAARSSGLRQQPQQQQQRQQRRLRRPEAGEGGSKREFGEAGLPEVTSPWGWRRVVSGEEANTLGTEEVAEEQEDVLSMWNRQIQGSAPGRTVVARAACPRPGADGGAAIGRVAVRAQTAAPRAPPRRLPSAAVAWGAAGGRGSVTALRRALGGIVADPCVCMLKKMGEAVARVARKVNETVESGSDTLAMLPDKVWVLSVRLQDADFTKSQISPPLDMCLHLLRLGDSETLDCTLQFSLVGALAKELLLSRIMGNVGLDLAECKLVSFPIGIYKVLRNVTDQIHLITLANNELKSLTSKFMTTFCELQGEVQGHLQTGTVIVAKALIDPQWAELRLEGNFLHRLPNEVGTLQHLKAIDLSRNQFRDFPEQLTLLPALETINLEENEIVGMVAQKLTALKSDAFWPEDMVQTRNVPVEKLAAMPSLRSVNLRFNPLNAEVRVIAPPLIKFDMLMSPEGARPPPP
ncbi:Leucine-rich repeat-containing protein 20 [Galemys pyrenaicus]|uniref:Leucine-rich repeat-containing protein 20 n=1 Tax=Galemys pyrenaicus TaxID=202257 RepID=A0A8J6DIJ6_GALPY|nr:Leucine-rich repeat-containing protein 20 [Galemys pyrenaicus]